MKSSLVCLTILVSLILANSSMEGHFEGTPNPLPSADDIIDSNAYDPEHQYSTAFAIFTDYWCADDFTPSADYSIEILTLWDLSTGSMPTSVDAYFWEDAPPGPGTELWNGTVSGGDLVHNSTGITFAGYMIYMTVASLPDTDYFMATSGETYWTTFQRTDGINFYCILDDEVAGTECYRDIGSGWVPGSTTGYDPTDMFRIIECSFYPALERDTWGSIKALF
jgi:hypothetical protein